MVHQTAAVVVVAAVVVHQTAAAVAAVVVAAVEVRQTAVEECQGRVRCPVGGDQWQHCLKGR